ncbi:MAG: M20 family metallopeptidase [Verrucomicrobiota bacterium]|nr:M20 family metallopeptidase [Verrucomicrobiota bacterium]
MASQPTSVRLLQDLIALPSVNPAFFSDPQLHGEHRVAAFLESAARRQGLDVESQAVVPGRSNLLVRLSPRGEVRHRVLLAPHMDTVGEPAYALQLTPVVRGGRIYGRGACDTKGSVAAFFQSLLNVAASGPRPNHTEILFVGLIDEENMQLGSRHFAQHGPQGDLAIVGEPTGLEIVTAHKGDVWLRLRTTGRSAHGATPHRGKNAVTAMARIVLALETEYAAELAARPAHPRLGRPTVNVGRIDGGRQPNIVPAECTIDIDRRTLPGETEAGVRREIIALLRRHGLKAAYDNLRTNPCEPLDTCPDLPLVRSLTRAAGRKGTRGVHYFTDAAPLAAGGTPSVVFGPGDIAQAHTEREWLAISQLEKSIQILERFLRALN